MAAIDFLPRSRLGVYFPLSSSFLARFLLQTGFPLLWLASWNIKHVRGVKSGAFPRWLRALPPQEPQMMGGRRSEDFAVANLISRDPPCNSHACHRPYFAYKNRVFVLRYGARRHELIDLFCSLSRCRKRNLKLLPETLLVEIREYLLNVLEVLKAQIEA